MSTIGSRIRAKRQQLNMSVDELATKLGKNRATVYRYESDDIENFPLSIITPLAEALQVSPGYLMGWMETEQPATENDDRPAGHLSEKKPALGSESGPDVNIVKIAGRDGRFIEKELNDKQLQALIAFVDLLPDASDDL